MYEEVVHRLNVSQQFDKFACVFLFLGDTILKSTNPLRFTLYGTDLLFSSADFNLYRVSEL